MTAHSVVVNDSIDAVWIRDALIREAERHEKAARKSEQSMLNASYGTREYTRASNTLVEHEAHGRILRDYADRFDQIRRAEADKIRATLGL